jgi:hypothetical protein
MMRERVDTTTKDHGTGKQQEQISCTTTTTKACDDKRYSSTLKYFLSKYLQFIKIPHRQDSILKTVQYSLWLLSKFYRNTVIPGNTKRHHIPHRMSDALMKLSGEISWARYVLRFFGLPAAIDGVDIRSWALENNSKRLGQVMSWTMIAYYPLEHLAYLCYKAPSVSWLPYCAITTSNACKNDVDSISNNDRYNHFSSRLASKASAWSCRFWLTYLILDIYRCTLSLRELKQNPHQTSKSDDLASSSASDKNENNNNNNNNKLTQINKQDSEVATVRTDVRTEHLQIVRNILFFLPAVNWSLPNWDTQPWLHNDLVNGLCWIESMVGLLQGVRDFQQI